MSIPLRKSCTSACIPTRSPAAVDSGAARCRRACLSYTPRVRAHQPWRTLGVGAWGRVKGLLMRSTFLAAARDPHHWPRGCSPGASSGWGGAEDGDDGPDGEASPRRSSLSGRPGCGGACPSGALLGALGSFGGAVSLTTNCAPSVARTFIDGSTLTLPGTRSMSATRDCNTPRCRASCACVIWRDLRSDVSSCWSSL